MGNGFALGLLITLLCALVPVKLDTVYSFPKPVVENWRQIGERELKEALNINLNNNKAKNVILFIGDGMGISTLTASRIYKGQLKGSSGEEDSLVFERFPHLGLSKTYNVDSQVSDSAGTATAILCGEKVNIYTLGLDSKVKENDCFESSRSRLKSIADVAQDADIATGVVTNSRITHATPASLYAHSPSRYWESKVPATCPHYKDIAMQLLQDSTARRFKVIFGGGRSVMGAAINETSVKQSLLREDSRNLTHEWLADRKKRNIRAAYLETKQQLLGLKLNTVDHILGLFADNHLEYVADGIPNDQPTLQEMVEVAIKHLSKNQQRYFLLVEGSRIDMAHHENLAGKALPEVMSFDKTIERTLQLIDTDETLVIVTADHSHSFTINGYPRRGHNILGHAEKDEKNISYPTLMYSTGPGYKDKYYIDDNEIHRKNTSEKEEVNKDFAKLTPVVGFWGDATHGGEDVAIYAKGPKAHLFHGLHEQNYIFHVMSYAMCIHPSVPCAAPYLSSSTLLFIGFVFIQKILF